VPLSLLIQIPLQLVQPTHQRLAAFLRHEEGGKGGNEGKKEREERKVGKKKKVPLSLLIQIPLQLVQPTHKRLAALLWHVPLFPRYPKMRVFLQWEGEGVSEGWREG
jgi:hypothetical protein